MTITGRNDGRDFYPDTEAGAIELVKKFTAINDEVSWSTIMDREVKGCWLVLGHSKSHSGFEHTIQLRANCAKSEISLSKGNIRLKAPRIRNPKINI